MNPTCPVCNGKRYVKSRGPLPFDCLTCNTLFDGSQSEREANQGNRERYSQHRLTIARLNEGTDAAKPSPDKPQRRLRVVRDEEKP